MLETKKYRPEGLTYVFEPNVDIQLIEEQLKARSTPLAEAIKNGNASITWQSPTQSECTGLILEVNEFKGNADDLVSTITDGAKSLGVKLTYTEVDLGSGKIAFLMEMWGASALISQTKHKISDLPA